MLTTRDHSETPAARDEPRQPTGPPASSKASWLLHVLFSATLTGLVFLSALASRTLFSATPSGATASARARPNPETEDEKHGARTYAVYCGGCHGDAGDGKGPAHLWLDPRPRDFTRGVYKWRTTPSGSLPTDADIARTIRLGVHGASMPNWQLLSDRDVTGLVAYLKRFSPKFAENPPPRPMTIPPAPAHVGQGESIARGRVLWDKMKCASCHGEGGKGDGPSSATLVDDWGEKIRPFDFTRGTPKGGARPEDFYRAFSTGLSGTPMPSYADILSDAERWDLVSYTVSLRTDGHVAGGTPPPPTPLTATPEPPKTADATQARRTP